MNKQPELNVADCSYENICSTLRRYDESVYALQDA